jgi:hypothetical protein
MATRAWTHGADVRCRRCARYDACALLRLSLCVLCTARALYRGGTPASNRLEEPSARTAAFEVEARALAALPRPEV